jgi:threonine dehydratase
MIPYTWLEDAAERITAHIHITPLTYDPDHDLYLKWENRQITGSFKVRGALNKVLNLERWEQQAGMLAASAGNHGQGVAFAGKLVGAPVKVFVPEHTPSVKVEAIQSFNAEVQFVPGGYGQAETMALESASESDITWVSPYNDGHIIAGQGTLGVEILKQLAATPKFQADGSVWIVPASGGGLISGVGAALSTQSPRPKLVAVQSDTSPFLHSLFYRGSQDGIEERPTIAEGLAGAVQEGSITIPMVRQFVDEVILVNEEEIAEAIAHVWLRYGERIEGAAAVGIAAILNGKITKRPAVVILSGGNIQDEIFEKIIGTKA